jgi:hypothetical protein
MLSADVLSSCQIVDILYASLAGIYLTVFGLNTASFRIIFNRRFGKGTDLPFIVGELKIDVFTYNVNVNNRAKEMA